MPNIYLDYFFDPAMMSRGFAPVDEPASRTDRKVRDLLDDVQTWRRVGAAFTRQEAEARAHNLRIIAEIAAAAADEAVAVWIEGNPE